MSADIELQKKILDELAWEPAVHAAHIGVAVRDGVATLTGHVESYGEKLIAERVAKRVKGVRALVQEIDVKLPSSHQRLDEDIAASALAVLQWHTGLPANRIQVQVENGEVTLTGEVDWRHQKEAAERDIRHIMGMRSITNRISIKPSVPPTEIKHKIEEAFKRNANLEAAHITVSATGGAVTLSGHVKTWYEREMAEQAAWSAPGVTTVADHLDVGP